MVFAHFSADRTSQLTSGSCVFVVLDVALCSISGCVATLAQTTDSKLASKGGIATRPKMEGLQQASIVSVDSRYSR